MRSDRSKVGTRTKDEVSKILKLKSKDWKEFESEGLFEFLDKERKLIDEKNFERLRVAVSLKQELGVNTAGIDVILNMREKMARMQMDMNQFLATVRKKFQHQLHENAKKLEQERK